MASKKESWNSHTGVILAVAGSAVGLGNFLRFPGKAAEFGGGAFMLAYFISFIILGLPICWAEWTMGRSAGQKGFHSCPGILTVIWRHPAAKYVGVIGIVIPIVIYMYYVYIEAWCLGYAVNFLAGTMNFTSVDESAAFWGQFIGADQNGAAVGFSLKAVGGYLVAAFALNIILINRGLAKGIEWFCKYAMPTLIILAFIILVRVLTLGTPDVTQPERSIMNGLGFMWNPGKVVIEDTRSTPPVKVGEILGGERKTIATVDLDKNPYLTIREVSIWEQLSKPGLWLAAAGQIFFSLSIGFGIILTYASYLSRRDDVVLSGLAASSTNEFCEVALGGLITIPAGFAFLGAAGIAGAGLGTFDLGFKVLPLVFSKMPLGMVFGALFFFLLFLAAVTSSLSMLQPGIAFLGETLKLRRKHSVAIISLVTALGCGFVVYSSAGVKALDTLDFWVGTFLIYILATVQILLFGWGMGVEKGFAAAHEGAIVRIPKAFKFLMKYVCPLFLLTIFAGWLLIEVCGIGGGSLDYHITDLFGTEPHPVAWASIGLITVVALGALIIVKFAGYRYVSMEQHDTLTNKMSAKATEGALNSNNDTAGNL